MMNLKNGVIASLFFTTTAISQLNAFEAEQESMDKTAQDANKNTAVKVNSIIVMNIEGSPTQVAVTAEIIAGSVIITPIDPATAGFNSISASTTGAGESLVVTAATVSDLNDNTVDMRIVQRGQSQTQTQTDDSQGTEEQEDQDGSIVADDNPALGGGAAVSLSFATLADLTALAAQGSGAQDTSRRGSESE